MNEQEADDQEEDNESQSSSFMSPLTTSSSSFLSKNRRGKANPSSYDFSIGFKGKLTKKLVHPRERKDNDHFKELIDAMGGCRETAEKSINNFKQVNESNVERADGIIYQIINTYPNLRWRTIKTVFKIGSGWLLCIKKNAPRAKRGDSAGMSGGDSALKCTNNYLFLLVY